MIKTEQDSELAVTHKHIKTVSFDLMKQLCTKLGKLYYVRKLIYLVFTIFEHDSKKELVLRGVKYMAREEPMKCQLVFIVLLIL